ncbi:OsmC family protein [Agromyces tropicus]|uniref:OsmC family protein n=1 Tax=Agromyces tropicus TaxID=555371 RepID=A0ABN2UWJ4_9MICO
MTEHAHAVGERIARGSVSVTRTGARTYEGLNERGSTVLIGPVDAPGHFTPGELFKLALAGCAGMSADSVAARRLGDDVAITVWAHGSSKDGNRYREIDEEIVIDLSSLEPDEREKLAAIMARAIEKACTVARSVDGAVDLHTTVDGIEI